MNPYTQTFAPQAQAQAQPSPAMMPQQSRPQALAQALQAQPNTQGASSMEGIAKLMQMYQQSKKAQETGGQAGGTGLAPSGQALMPQFASMGSGR